ncbi:MAG: hypothetical protein JXQ90_04915 [Cyclobacteriaceae bacterium]
MPNTTRQLAAVLFSDIVGYTALMGKDSAKALELVRISKDIQKPLVEKHNGKWLKEMGDGAMAQFGSALDAVNCAIEIQAEARAKLDAKLRIGIHLGDITVEGQDIYGDGVNVASRIESLADPGGICISHSVRRAIKGEDISTIDLGNKELKNVDEPVQVFAVQGVGLPIPLTKSKKGINRNQSVLISALAVIIVAGIYVIGSKWTSFDPQNQSKIKLSLDKSIAVMPFNNESSDEENQYFVNGMMEDIRNNLAKISDLRVISKTSTEKYRGTILTSNEIGKELSISYLLEGSVQKIGTHVKIHAQLISTANDDHIWQDTYVRDIADVREVFAIQSQIAETIASELSIVVKPEESRLIANLPTASAEAYDLYLKGREHARLYSQSLDSEEFDKAIELFHQAVSLDANFAVVYAEAAGVLRQKERRSEDFFEEQYLDTVLFLCNQAISLNPNLAEAYFQRFGYHFTRGNIQDAQIDLVKALELNTNSAIGNRYMALLVQDVQTSFSYLRKAESLEMGEDRRELLIDIGRQYGNYGLYEKAEAYLLKSLNLGQSIFASRYLCWFNVVQGNFEQAYLYAKALKSYNPDIYSTNIRLAISLDYLGRFKEAEPYWEIGIQMMQAENENLLNETHRYAYHLWNMGEKDSALIEFGRQEQFCKQMIEKERYGGSAYYDLASIYAFLGEKEKALQNLELSNDSQRSLMNDFVQVDPLFDAIRGEDRFKAIVTRGREQLLKNQQLILEMEKSN